MRFPACSELYPEQLMHIVDCEASWYITDIPDVSLWL